MAVRNAKNIADTIKKVERGSKEHEALLSVGYGMDKAKAMLIIKERKENPLLWPYEEYEKAEIFLNALKKRSVKPSSPNKGWKRSQVLV